MSCYVKSLWFSAVKENKWNKVDRARRNESALILFSVIQLICPRVSVNRLKPIPPPHPRKLFLYGEDKGLQDFVFF